MHFLLVTAIPPFLLLQNDPNLLRAVLVCVSGLIKLGAGFSKPEILEEIINRLVLHAQAGKMPLCVAEIWRDEC